MQSNIYRNEKTGIQDFFDSQVDRSPEAVALVCGEQRLTYQELDDRANQVARYLQFLGVEPEMLVGICTDRSVEMVIGILGILKAGGAYVPLDPSYPQERFAFILEDAQAECVITQNRFLEMFSRRDMKIVSLDGNRAEIAKQPTDRLPTTTISENLAYVIYTSGSTGKPKGVMITHSNLCHFASIACAALNVTPEDVYLQTASIAYALSVRQLVVPLTHGATVVLATTDEIRDPILLFGLIKREHITLVDIVPSYWRSCIQRLSELPMDERSDLLDNTLRRIVSIGEPLLSDLPRDWAFKLGHPAKLVNIFGQTETTGVVATYPIVPELQNRMEVVPIGKHVSETELYILDPNLRPVDKGMTGELCVSNPCLARGYLNHPELTSKKFILNPFKENGRDRLYRTGDMARYREDGNIEFLGRSDFQVKIRGQRLELGEVEAVLREHASVRECVALTRGNHPDEKYLVAYIVPVAGQSLDKIELRNFVRKRAPDHMIPSNFVFLDSIPLTPNGKIDRLALPDPSADVENKQTSQQLFAKPRNQIEQHLADIWMELLTVGNVGIYDNFFDLGGHSLTVVRLFSRLEQDFGVRLPATTILQAATIATLAVQLETPQTQVDAQILVPIQTNGHRPPLYYVHGLGGGVLGYRDLVNALSDDQPIYGLQAIGQANHDIHDPTIEAMASRYIDAIRSFQPTGPYQIAGYCFGGVVAYEMARQLETQGEKVSLLAVFEGFISGSMNASAPFLQRVNAFWKSIPFWIEDYASMGPDGLRHRIRSLFAKAWFKLGLQKELDQRARVEDILDTDLDNVPARDLELTKINSNAFRNYKPGTYSGKVTLFRARNRSFNDVMFGSLDPQMGWGNLAKGGVTVKLVDGFHRNIHLPPYVDSLAAALSDCLKAGDEED